MKETHMSERIRELLHKLKMNQSEFAREINVSPQTVSAYLKGMELSIDKITLINKKFNVSIEWLMTGTGEMFINDMKKESISSESKSFADEVIQKLYDDLDYYKKLVTDLTEEKRIMLTMMSKSSGNRLVAHAA